MGKAPVQATIRCAHAFSHTHIYIYIHRLFISVFLSRFLSYTLKSLSTLLLQVITCLLSQCQSLGRRQRDIGKIIIGKICAAVITCTRATRTQPLWVHTEEVERGRQDLTTGCMGCGLAIQWDANHCDYKHMT